MSKPPANESPADRQTLEEVLTLFEQTLTPQATPFLSESSAFIFEGTPPIPDRLPTPSNV